MGSGEFAFMAIASQRGQKLEMRDGANFPLPPILILPRNGRRELVSHPSIAELPPSFWFLQPHCSKITFFWFHFFPGFFFSSPSVAACSALLCSPVCCRERERSGRRRLRPGVVGGRALEWPSGAARRGRSGRRRPRVGAALGAEEGRRADHPARAQRRRVRPRRRALALIVVVAAVEDLGALRHLVLRLRKKSVPASTGNKDSTTDRRTDRQCGCWPRGRWWGPRAGRRRRWWRSWPATPRRPRTTACAEATADLPRAHTTTA